MHLTAQIKKDLASLGISPDKKLGQHFLISEGIYKSIVEALDPTADDRILEIGTGLGTLTEFIAKRGSEIQTIEKDDTLAEFAKKKFIENPRITVTNDDVLRFDPSTYGFADDCYKIVGNIPYYLTARLLRTIFEKWPRASKIVLMIQREVAQKIAAKPPDMTLLSNMVAFYASVKMIRKVPADNFLPPPTVESEIILLTPKKNVDKRVASEIMELIKACFVEKRKQLGPKIAKYAKLTNESAANLTQNLGIDPKRRAESLTQEEWLILFNGINH